MKQLFLMILFAVLAIQMKAAGFPAPTSQQQDTVYKSEKLIIRKLSAHTFQHISYLQTGDFGKVPCNGMIVAVGKEAIVFDTPADAESTAELIGYLSGEKRLKIKALIATHFHVDCVAGLPLFHHSNIPSYANNATISRLRQNTDSTVIPRNGFDKSLELTVDGKKVYAAFFGEGHTKDNVVGWYAEDQVLFGGCLIKETGSDKGNLEDANVSAWSETVEKIKRRYSQVAIVIPGHGKTGGTELLDYTMQLFAGN